MKIRRYVTLLLLALAMGGSSLTASAGLLSALLRPVSAIIQPVTVIVRLKPGGSIGGVLGLLNGLLLDQIPGTDTYLVSLPSLPSILPLAVESVERDTAIGLPGNTASVTISPSVGMSALWYGNQTALSKVNSPAAHRYSKGYGVVVADIDARFDTSHPALEGRLVNGHDFVADDNSATGGGLDQSSASYMFQSSASYMFQSSASYMFQSSASYLFQQLGLLSGTSASAQKDDAGTTHGTFTAGLIAAVAPGASIMPIRAFDNSGDADLFTLAKSIRYAVENGANVINMSWGTDSNSQTLHDAINFALAHNVILIAAAGNSDNASPYYPAAYAGVLAIAATDNQDRKASFSSFGRFVAVSAPGVNIISAYPGGHYGIKSGTSFSAPIVAGEAALLEAAGCSDVTALLSSSARNIDSKNPRYRGELGRGRVNLLQGVRDTSCEGGNY